MTWRMALESHLEIANTQDCDKCIWEVQLQYEVAMIEMSTSKRRSDSDERNLRIFLAYEFREKQQQNQ